MLRSNEFQSAAELVSPIVASWADLPKRSETQLKNNRTPLNPAPDQGLRLPASFARLAVYLRQSSHRLARSGLSTVAENPD